MKKEKISRQIRNAQNTFRLRQYHMLCRLYTELEELSSSIHQEEYECRNKLMAYILDGNLHINYRNSVAFLLRGTSVLYFTMNSWKWRTSPYWNIRMLFMRCQAELFPRITGYI